LCTALARVVLAASRGLAHNTGTGQHLATETKPGAGMSTKVTIYDQTYNIAGDLDPAYVEGLAQAVDAKMREIARATGMVDSVKIAVLAALAITDELETLRRNRNEGRQELRERAESCLKLVERALQQSA
jgi:cell division protein ZapA